MHIAATISSSVLLGHSCCCDTFHWDKFWKQFYGPVPCLHLFYGRFEFWTLRLTASPCCPIPTMHSATGSFRAYWNIDSPSNLVYRWNWKSNQSFQFFFNTLTEPQIKRVSIGLDDLVRISRSHIAVAGIPFPLSPNISGFSVADAIMFCFGMCAPTWRWHACISHRFASQQCRLISSQSVPILLCCVTIPLVLTRPWFAIFVGPSSDQTSHAMYSGCSFFVSGFASEIKQIITQTCMTMCTFCSIDQISFWTSLQSEHACSHAFHGTAYILGISGFSSTRVCPIFKTFSAYPILYTDWHARYPIIVLFRSSFICS